MNRRRPSRFSINIAAALIIGALIALVALPLAVRGRVQRLQTAIERRAEPARNDLNEVNYQLSRQVASLSRFVVTDDVKYLDAYRDAVSRQQSAIQLLSTHIGVLGTAPVERFTHLRDQIGRWHNIVDRFVTMRRTRPPLAQEVAYEGDYPAVIESVYRLDEAISAFQNEQREILHRVQRLQTIVTVALVILALAAALSAAWMLTRFRSLTSSLLEESEERMAALERERHIRRTAEAAIKSRDEILGIVSHDLRSPLTTIMLSTQLLPGSSPEEETEHVTTILSTARRMERLIQDLLDATRSENGLLSIKRDLLDPAALVDEVVASYAPIAAQKQVALEPSVQLPVQRIIGDHDRLVQALGNLIGNSMKFTPSEGVVRVVVQPGDHVVSFSVEDSGPGIAPSELPHIFEPFWQSKKTAHLGAGLGLKITRAIVEAHGGAINVVNVPTGGACFTFEVPAAQPEAPS